MSLLDKYIESDNSSKSKEFDLDWIDELFSITNTNKTKTEKIDKVHDYFNIKFEESDDSIFDLSFEDEILHETDINDSTENKVNFLRSKLLDSKFTNEFLSILRDEDFEFGFISRSEKLIYEQLNINALATRNWLNELFIKYFSNETIIIGILRILGRFDPSLIFPQGQTIALAALNHSNDEIKELSIRAFEKWCSVESLGILKSIQVDTPWLQEYILDVISDFEEQLCHY